MRMLLKDGAQALRELVWDGALPWPVASSLYRLANELPEPPQMVLWKIENSRMGEQSSFSA